MREIKFRAWSGTAFLNPSEFCIFGDGSLYSLNQEINLGCGRSHINNLSAKIMQYTGLKDKNGIEIYEGDIIGVGLTKKQYTVKHNKENSSFRLFTLDCLFENSLSLQGKNFIVLGNIYENQEPLK